MSVYVGAIMAEDLIATIVNSQAYLLAEMVNTICKDEVDDDIKAGLISNAFRLYYEQAAMMAGLTPDDIVRYAKRQMENKANEKPR